MNLFLNFARKYEINSKNIFDKLNQMNISKIEIIQIIVPRLAIC